MDGLSEIDDGRGNRPIGETRCDLHPVLCPVTAAAGDLGRRRNPVVTGGANPVAVTACYALVAACAGRATPTAAEPGVDEETAVFNKRTTAWFDPIEQAGWRDAFWLVHGVKREFTWHSRGHDSGFRLDQAFVSPELVDHVTDARHGWVEDVDEVSRCGVVSDHAALIVEFDVTGYPAAGKPPG